MKEYTDTPVSESTQFFRTTFLLALQISFMQRMCEDILFEFCTNFNSTRNTLVWVLFGESTIEDVIKNTYVLLPNLGYDSDVWE
jgi:hypothetical protein